MNSKPKHIDQDAWDAVDSPELTDDELARMKPAREVLKPALFEKLAKGRGPQKKPTKEPVYLRLDREVVEHFRAMGPGWQTKVNEALRESIHERTHTVARSGKQMPRAASSGVYVTRASGAKSEKSVVRGGEPFSPKGEARTGRWTSAKKQTSKPSRKK